MSLYFNSFIVCMHARVRMCDMQDVFNTVENTDEVLNADDPEKSVCVCVCVCVCIMA